MKGGNLLRQLIPNVWETIEKRNLIKSEYRRAKERLRNEDDFQIEVNESAKLGDTLEYFHFRMMSKIQNTCFENSDGSYVIVEENKQKIRNYLLCMIILIRIRNIISILFWVLLIVFIIMVVVTGGNISLEFLPTFN